MRPPTSCPLAGLALILLASPPLAAQALGSPTATWDHEFSGVGGIAELADGRVVIVDRRDEAVVVAPARGGGPVAPRGRTGDGPGEYRAPWSVLRWRGDTLLVAARARLVQVAPNGRIAGSIPFTPATLGGLAPPRGADARGALYWDRPVIRDPRTGAIKRQQQYEIVRWLPGSARVELVATASDHAPGMHQHRFHPFAERDAWVVDPDGTLRIVRASGYRVDAVRNGAVAQRGPQLTAPRVPVTAADREAYRRERAANPSGASVGGAASLPPGEVSPAALARMREAFPDAFFPAEKPPFVEDGAHRAPDGTLWVVRSQPGSSQGGAQVDLIGADGRRRGQLTLPSGRRLAALERGGVYLVHEDGDGLQRVERYAYPR